MNNRDINNSVLEILEEDDKKKKKKKDGQASDREKAMLYRMGPMIHSHDDVPSLGIATVAVANTGIAAPESTIRRRIRR